MFTVARDCLPSRRLAHHIAVQQVSNSQCVREYGWKALKMLKTLSSELREVVWLASVVGGLSVAGVSIAIAAVVALEHLSVVAHV